ncbi:MAG: hypothetical protein JNM00_04640 [Flavobacteriales bacterium]|nr:hypothetical protein [Flavobacteriales bacterium]
MKKSILFLALALLMSIDYATAQKQVGSDKNFEFTFAPLGGNPVGIQGIRLRSFNSDGTGAIRLGLYIGGMTDVTVNTQPGMIEEDQPELLTTDKSFNFSIRPGYEKHFEGTDRLSPYVGGEIFIGMGSTSTETEYYSTNDFDDADNYVVWTDTQTDGDMTIGLNILAGFDFYFHDNIYLGAEMGFGFQSTNIKDGEYEVSDLDAFKIYNGIPEDTDVEFDPTINGKNSAWGPNVQGTLRLGVLIN